jgi:hypothetical protein
MSLPENPEVYHGANRAATGSSPTQLLTFLDVISMYQMHWLSYHTVYLKCDMYNISLHVHDLRLSLPKLCWSTHLIICHCIHPWYLLDQIITMLLLYFIRVYEGIRQHLIDDDGYTIAPRKPVA